MNTFNVWKLMKDQEGPTGPWSFIGLVQASSYLDAYHVALNKYGTGTYQLYQG